MLCDFVFFFSPHHPDPWLLRSKSPVGNPQLIQFSREVIDLLKSQPSCVIPISNFIPSYHHHFAKQCRVSDYGYSKLIELLEAVPHVLQVRVLRNCRLKMRVFLCGFGHLSQINRKAGNLINSQKVSSEQNILYELSLVCGTHIRGGFLTFQKAASFQLKGTS